ncbi:Mob1/phocein [Xylaria bambusicola]|uniref:Mob1/phocein n=1 Tax=Xylaria bambusicola TaxID=326684 RepID=UPI0020087704|nr:Mob1/phocein [Xylaria bambusicola]KAI0506431.1 Mob1/phocein [Xylaria bambusicola]
MSLTQGSPRLPSPPPPAEIQLSPSLNAAANRQTPQMEQTINDANAKRRIHPGTKAEDMAAGPPLVPLNELDSAFQLQEHLAALHYHHTASNTTAITRAAAAQLTQPPPGIDRTLWLYELCRFLIAECNSLIVGFLFDNPPCSSATCPEMRASEWQFLCAVHDQPKSCCAIDYCCHTLDWAANVVTNPKIFPSRFVLVSEGHDKSAVLKNLVNVFRRLHRIFAHAWFQHRQVFWSVESRTGLYAFFKTVCDMYDLLPAENYKLPPEAEGLEPGASNKEEKRPTVTSIVKSNSHHNDDFEHEDDRSSLHARRSNTARHSSRPSTGSAVTTVIEEGEDEHSEVADKLKEMRISAKDITEEESEVEVPVIVEGDIGIDTRITESSARPGDPDRPQSDPTGEVAQNTALTNVETSQIPSEQVADESQPRADNEDKQSTPAATDSVPEEAASTTAENASENAAESSPKQGEEKTDPEDSSTG